MHNDITKTNKAHRVSEYANADKYWILQKNINSVVWAIVLLIGICKLRAYGSNIYDYYFFFLFIYWILISIYWIYILWFRIGKLLVPIMKCHKILVLFSIGYTAIASYIYMMLYKLVDWHVRYESHWHCKRLKGGSPIRSMDNFSPKNTKQNINKFEYAQLRRERP